MDSAIDTLSVSRSTRWVIFVAILLLCAVIMFTAIRHGIAEHWARSTDPAQWLRAAQLEPSNADNWYRLGRYRQFDFENNDLKLAIDYYQRSTAIHPNSPHYWLDLGTAYEQAGDVNSAEQSYRKAQQNYPISAEVAWTYGNFLLRQGRVQEAFMQIHHALDSDPKLTPLAVSIAWRSIPDMDQILDFALPATPDVYWSALQVFIDAKQPAPAMEVWKRLMKDKPSFPVTKALPLLDLLFAPPMHVDDARLVWQQALVAAGIPAEPATTASMVWNGGFEQELLNGGFSWRYLQVKGAEIGLDEGTVHSGRRSLRLVFDGTENVNFANVVQYVAVEPNTTYRFSSYIKTEDLTTESGIRFDISDVGPNGLPAASQRTANITGTQNWALNETDFTTGAHTQLVRIALTRDYSKMLVSKIRGTVWVDDVSLRPLPPKLSAERE